MAGRCRSRISTFVSDRLRPLPTSHYAQPTVHPCNHACTRTHLPGLAYSARSNALSKVVACLACDFMEIGSRSKAFQLPSVDPASHLPALPLAPFPAPVSPSLSSQTRPWLNHCHRPSLIANPFARSKPTLITALP